LCLNHKKLQEGKKDSVIQYQQKKALEMKEEPSQPLLLQLQARAESISEIIPEIFKPLFTDETLDLIFVDTENDHKKWDLKHCREFSFYSLKLKHWQYFKYDTTDEEPNKYKEVFDWIAETFELPHFVHYNFVEKKILNELFETYGERQKIDCNYWDLLKVTRAIVDIDDPSTKTHLY
jgi:hypothetical protein